MSFKELFYLRKSDRQVIFVLMVMIVFVCGILIFVGGGRREAWMMAEDSAASINRNEGYPSFSGRRGYPHQRFYYATDGRKAELFPFDPNTADSTQLLRLGLSPWQVRNIYRYRAKGGVYRTVSDFSRLFGLTKGQYARMKPFIHIADVFQPLASQSVGKDVRDTLRYPVKIKSAERVVLNEADTNQLKTVPGIGSGYARAIVNYGNRLGGYYSVEQLREIPDFPEEALHFFIIQTPVLKKINVNLLTLNQLRRHPYISFYQAKAITDYHRLHGPLKSLADLSLLKDFPPEAIRRLEPYVEY